MADFETLVDHKGQNIRLTHERWNHILDHPEMEGERSRIEETLSNPEIIIATVQDQSVHTYHRFYKTTPVTSKYMIVAVKILDDDAFVVTAFYSNRMKKGGIVWQP
jgi:hypothetical protein